MEFKQGVPQDRVLEVRDGFETSPMKIIGDTDKRGTEVHFLPDETIFTQHRLPLRRPGQAPARAELPEQRREDPPGRRAQQQGRQLCLRRRREGLRGVHQHRQEGAAPEHLPRHGRQAERQQNTNVGVEVAMQWNDGYNENVLCFTNNIPQRDGGTHLTGLRAAMTRVINKYIEDNELAKKAKVEISRRRHARRPGLRGEREGARAQVQQPDQGQAGQLRSARPVEDIVSKLLTDWLLENPPTPRSSAARSSTPPAPVKPPARPAR
jgi:DNA gyrase subunit B